MLGLEDFWLGEDTAQLLIVQSLITAADMRKLEQLRALLLAENDELKAQVRVSACSCLCLCKCIRACLRACVRLCEGE